MPHSKVTALDISPAALTVAAENAENIGVAPQITFLLSDVFSAVEGRNADYDFENGESLTAMYARVTGKIREIAAAHRGRKVVGVVHGGVLDIINRFVRGNPLEMPRDFLIPNARLNWIAAVDGAWRIETWGETAHLEAGALDELPS